MAYHYKNPKPNNKSKISITAVLAILITASLIGWLVFGGNKAEAPKENAVQTAESNNNNQPEYTPIDLQPIVDQWLERQNADYSIVIYDAQSKSTVAQHQADKKYFAASLYKQFVAYLSLLDIQNNDRNPDEILWGGITSKECIDKMIRESHSPCGEAMMADIGQTVLNKRVADMGMTGTTFNGIQTTAHDSALILQHIIERRDLNEENTEFLLDSMLTQEAKYKRGLQSGAKEAKWQTKVGWNEDINYHDIGIMTLPDGRKFAVAILGQGSGSPTPISDFAATIYTALSN